MEGVVELILLAIRPDMRPGQESAWQVDRAENIRLEIAAMVGTSQTITFPNGNTWTVAVLSADTREEGGDTLISVRVRKL
jgi:hypothetical protein